MTIKCPRCEDNTPINDGHPCDRCNTHLRNEQKRWVLSSIWTVDAGLVGTFYGVYNHDTHTWDKDNWRNFIANTEYDHCPKTNNPFTHQPFQQNRSQQVELEREVTELKRKFNEFKTSLEIRLNNLMKSLEDKQQQILGDLSERLKQFELGQRQTFWNPQEGLQQVVLRQQQTFWNLQGRLQQVEGALNYLSANLQSLEKEQWNLLTKIDHQKHCIEQISGRLQDITATKQTFDQILMKVVQIQTFTYQKTAEKQQLKHLVRDLTTPDNPSAKKLTTPRSSVDRTLFRNVPNRYAPPDISAQCQIYLLNPKQKTS